MNPPEDTERTWKKVQCGFDLSNLDGNKETL